MHERIREIDELRGQLYEQMKELLAKDELTAEDQEKFDKLDAEMVRLSDEKERLERALAIEASLDTTATNRAGREDRSADNVRDDMERENAAFMNFVRFGIEGLSEEDRGIMNGLRASGVPNIRGTMSTGTGSEGGYTIPQGFYPRLIEAIASFGGMLTPGLCDLWETGTGNQIPIPTVNDSGNSGELLAENTQAAAQDVVFAQKVVDAYTYSSKIVKVPVQLLQDSFFNLEQKLAQWLGTRIARIVNLHLTTGTGSSQPNGVVTASTLGVTGATGQTTSVTADDLIDLIHSVDPAYRKVGTFQFADSVLKALKKLKQTDSDMPAWVPSLTAGEPDTIFGKPYVVNTDIADMAASAKSILFGDFQSYIIRRVVGGQLLRLTERYADYLQVGFLAFQRWDGELSDAGTHPIKHYANSAT